MENSLQIRPINQEAIIILRPEDFDDTTSAIPINHRAAAEISRSFDLYHVAPKFRTDTYGRYVCIQTRGISDSITARQWRPISHESKDPTDIELSAICRIAGTK